MWSETNNKEKKKAARMFKAPIAFIVFILVFTFLGYLLKTKKYQEIVYQYKLSNNGYSKGEISIIIHDENAINYALNHPYNSDIIKIMKNDNYISNNLELYIEGLKTNDNINEVIKDTNKKRD